MPRTKTHHKQISVRQIQLLLLGLFLMQTSALMFEESKSKNLALYVLFSQFALSLAWNPIKDVQRAVNNVGKTVGKIAKDTGKVVGGTVQGAGKIVGGVVQEAGKAVGGTIQEVGKAVGGPVNEIGKAVGGAVRGVTEVTGGAVKEVGKAAAGVAEGAGKLAEGTAQGAAALTEVTVDVTARVADKAGNVARKTGATIVETVEETGEAIKDQIEEGVAAVGRVAKGVGTLITEPEKALRNLERDIKNLPKATEEFVNLAVKPFTTVGSGALEIAKHIIQELEIPDFIPCPAPIPVFGHGCGPQNYAVRDAVIPESFIFCGAVVDFKPACSAHDACYDSCVDTRQVCDDSFEKALKKQCNVLNVDANKSLCFGLAKLYASTVRDNGQEHYSTACKGK